MQRRPKPRRRLKRARQPQEVLSQAVEVDQGEGEEKEATAVAAGEVAAGMPILSPGIKHSQHRLPKSQQKMHLDQSQLARGGEAVAAAVIGAAGEVEWSAVARYLELSERLEAA